MPFMHTAANSETLQAAESMYIYIYANQKIEITSSIQHVHQVSRSAASIQTQKTLHFRSQPEHSTARLTHDRQYKIHHLASNT